jgi:sensor histidine kinase YesM
MNENENEAVQQPKPIKWSGWIIHSVAWGAMLALPFLFSGREGSVTVTLDRYLGSVLIFSSYAVAFYANYLYLVRKFLFTKQLVRYFLSNALLFIALIIGVHFLFELFFSPPVDRPFPGLGRWVAVRFLVTEMLVYIFTVTISVAFRMTSSWYVAEAERKELERSHSEAELKNLKSQLNPHFLFNTLNNIYSLIAISPERAQEVVHELSRLLRYVLYDSTQLMVTIEKDMDFIRNYVELMRIRQPAHVSVKTSISYASPDITIAPLLFITLVENAFKHGVSNSKPSFIEINIQASDEEINCLILNSYFPKNESDKSGSGIGLSNLRRRLDLLYPSRYSLTYGREYDTYRCELKCRTSPLAKGKKG